MTVRDLFITCDNIDCCDDITVHINGEENPYRRWYHGDLEVDVFRVDGKHMEVWVK